MIDDKVRAVTLSYVDHLCAHLDAWRWHREGTQFEALSLLQILENRQGLVSGRVVIIDIGDFLALETAAQFVLNEVERGRALRPIGRGDGEEVREAVAVGRSRNAKSRRRAGDFVLLQLLVQSLYLRRPV